MVEHATQEAAPCPYKMSTEDASGPAKPSPDDCSFKICLEQPSDRWSSTDYGKDSKPMPSVMISAAFIILVALEAVGRVQRVDRRPRRYSTVPLIYQFCSLLN
jgi:hypothetical protein